MADKPGVASSFPDHCFDNDGNLDATGAADTYAVKTGRRIFGYYKGLRFCARIPVTNTGASTIVVDDAPAIAIRKSGNSALGAGDLVAGVYYDFIFDDANNALQVVDAGGSSLTAGDGIVIVGGAISTTIKRRNVADITAGDTMVASDRAKTVNIASGTGTMAFTAAATLADGWWAIIRNSGTGAVMLNPNGAETIDGLASWILYQGGAILVMCDGTAFYSTLLSPMVATFNASGTFTKPGVGTWADIEAWGGGGSGGRGTADTGGGGGGGYNRRTLPISSVGTTETVVVGAGGAGRSSASDGATGSDTTFGSLMTAYGGGGGDNAGNGGGGGGGQRSAGTIPTGAGGGAAGAPNFVLTTGISGTVQGSGGDASVGREAYAHGGGGGDGAFAGGQSVYGGGGGAGCNATTASTGGGSQFGGSGGASGVNGANGTSGTQPGGGGGAAESTATAVSGAGGDGRVIVRVY